MLAGAFIYAARTRRKDKHFAQLQEFCPRRLPVSLPVSVLLHGIFQKSTGIFDQMGIIIAIMDKLVLLDIAEQVARNVGRIDLAFPKRLSARIRRKFGLKISPEEVSALTAHCAAIYQAALELLPGCITPSADGYARLENIDGPRLAQLLGERFPQDDPQILTSISGWMIFYDYLH
jgi:hypothetical protein